MMNNSPKTSTSFSQLQNAFDVLMSDKYNQQYQNQNSYPKENSSQKIKNPNLFSPHKVSPQKVISSAQQFSIQMLAPDQLGMHSQIMDKSPMDGSRKMPIHPRSLQNQIIDRRLSGQFSQLIKSKDTRGNQQFTQNQSSQSFSAKHKILTHTESTSQLRKFVQNETILDALQSMFRKKNSLSSDINEGKNLEFYANQIKKSIQQQKNQQTTENEINLLKQKILQRSTLIQRLKNIHIFYRMRIDNQVNQRKTNDRVFINMLHENEILHKQKVQLLIKTISQEKQYKISLTKRERMVSMIESTTQQSIKQRQKARKSYAKLQQDFLRNKDRIQDKECHLQELAGEEQNLRDHAQNNEKVGLKIKKWRKSFENIMRSGQQTVQNLRRSFERQDDYY